MSDENSLVGFLPIAVLVCVFFASNSRGRRRYPGRFSVGPLTLILIVVGLFLLLKFL